MASYFVQAYSKDTEIIKYGVVDSTGKMFRKNFKTWDSAAKACSKMNAEPIEVAYEAFTEDATVTEQVVEQEAQPTPEQFQFNIGMFFQAVYDYCYTQVSDYLPQPHDYIYGSPNRPMSTTWARIPDAHYIQVDRRTEGVYTWVAVPYQLSLKVMNDYELTFIKAPEALQSAWNDLRSVPYTERPLEHKDGICDQCGHPDNFFYPLRLDGCTEWYCGDCFELHVLCHARRAVDRYEGEHYQDGQLQPVKL